MMTAMAKFECDLSSRQNTLGMATFKKVLNMFDSRLNMFNIGFLAVGTIEKPILDRMTRL
jgi:hypothetical protein